MFRALKISIIIAQIFFGFACSQDRELSWEHPKSETYDYLIYTFLGTIYAFFLVQKPDFKKSWWFQLTITICVFTSVYMIPLLMLLKIIFENQQIQKTKVYTLMFFMLLWNTFSLFVSV